MVRRTYTNGDKQTPFKAYRDRGSETGKRHLIADGAGFVHTVTMAQNLPGLRFSVGRKQLPWISASPIPTIPQSLHATFPASILGREAR